MMRLSPDHRLIAFTMSTDGSERYDLHVCDINKQIYREKMVPSMVVSVEWSNDPDVFYYTVPDDKWRPFQLYRWRLSNRTRELLFQEPDDRFFLDIHPTKDRKYLTINSNSKTTSEVQLLWLDQPIGDLFMFRKRQEGIECYVDHRSDGFYMITNAQEASNYKLVRIDEHSGLEVLLYQCSESDEKIDDMELFENSIVLYQKQAGLPFLRVLPSISGCQNLAESWIKVTPPALEEADRVGGLLTAVGNLKIDISSLMISYSNPLNPGTMLEVCLKKGSVNVVHQKERQSLADAYECYRVMADSDDGTRIPMTIVHQKHLVRDGSHPLLLRAYGAYGHDLELGFDSKQVFLLEQGWIICYAHIRGGSEMGRSWHTNATRHHKVRSFEDMTACGRWLIDHGYTSPQRLCVRGMSAGGLVCAYALIDSPEIFAGPSILAAPFVDMVNAMTDRQLPLTIHETEEWGDPVSDPGSFKAMIDYSPYERLKSAPALPPVYCTTSLCDVRVPYWQPLKFMARYRHVNPSASRTSLLNVTGLGSHFGTGGQNGPIQDASREFAFLWHFSPHRG